MYILAVFGILAFAGVAILVSQSLKPKTARAWLIALVATTLAWVAMLFLRLYLPTNLTILSWEAGELFNSKLTLTLDYHNWPYAISLLTICMAAIFTDTTQTNNPSAPLRWVGSITIALINLVGLLAGDPLTLAIAWALVDIIELLYMINLQLNFENNQVVATSFAIRLLSLFALLLATAVGWHDQPGFSLHAIPSNANWVFLLAVSLRLGILPLKLPFLNADELRQGMAVLLRFAPAASALALLTHLSSIPQTLPPVWLLTLRVVTALAMLYSALMFATRPEKFASRPYWLVALSSFAVQCALQGNPLASRAWGLALLLSGALLYLFDPPIRRIRFLPLVGIVGLVGLPYTLTASGWEGLIGAGFSFRSFIFIFSHALLLIGYLRYALESNIAITALEKHARITFPTGLVLILQTILILNITGWPGVLTLGLWVAPVISLLLVCLSVFAFFKLGLKVPFTNLEQRLPFYRIAHAVLTGIQSFFSLDWVYTAGSFLGKQIGKVTNLVTELVEGEGGILWSLVFLIALTTLFIAGVKLP